MVGMSRYINLEVWVPEGGLPTVSARLGLVVVAG